MATPAPSVRVVLSGVRSVTHLVYAASWLRHLLEDVAHGDGPVEVVVLDVGSGFGEVRVGEEQVRSYLPEDPRLDVVTVVRPEHWVARPGVQRVLLSIGSPGTRAWARMVRAGRGRRPHVVVVDEGIGSFGTIRSRRAAYRREGGSATRAALRAGVVGTGALVLGDVHWSLYERRDGSWLVREEVAREFRRRLSGSSPTAPVAVYLTQPWPELGVMSEGAYLEHLRGVREECAEAGLPLALRPHPSETPSRYAGFDLVGGRLPAELAREVVEATVAIGSNSTALLNLAAVHATTSLRVTAPGLGPLENALTERQRSLLSTFLPGPVEVTGLSARIAELRGHDAR
jgi:hypothetical protein